MPIFRKWMTKKVSETVEKAIEPAKEYIKTKKTQTGDQADLLAKILMLGCEIFMVWKLFSGEEKEQTRALPARPEPSHIVINNYITTKEEPKNDA